MSLMDIGISVGIAVFGGLLGMDKAHSFVDWIGPILMAIGAGYALWCGMSTLALGIGGMLLLKLITR